MRPACAGRLRRLYWKTLKGHDPRRYERLFNVDHPRWQAARRHVEPLRSLLHEHLDAQAVAGILPQPGVRTNFANPVNQGGRDPPARRARHRPRRLEETARPSLSYTPGIRHSR